MFTATGSINQAATAAGISHSFARKLLVAAGLVDPVTDDCNDDVIRAEIAPIHDVPDLQPDRRSGLDRGAQHVAG